MAPGADKVGAVLRLQETHHDHLAHIRRSVPIRYSPVSSRGTAVEGKLMLGLVTTPNGKAPMELREVAEPEPQRNEAVVAVHAFSLNRGELRSIVNNGEGWIPGQDIGGIVLHQAADGSGPPVGARVVALT